MRGYIMAQIAEAGRVMSAMLADEALVASVQGAAQACVACLKDGGKVLLAGNGGSAADAQHMAAEYVNRFAVDRPGLAAVALTTDTSILTSIGNDYGYEKLFARQYRRSATRATSSLRIRLPASPQTFFSPCMSCARGLICVGFPGIARPMADACDYYLAVPSSDTPKIQEGILCSGTFSGLAERPCSAARRDGGWVTRRAHLDRDGVINVDRPICAQDQFEFVRESLIFVGQRQTGIPVIVVSNQAGSAVATTVSENSALSEWMCKVFHERRAPLTKSTTVHSIRTRRWEPVNRLPANRARDDSSGGGGFRHRLRRSVLVGDKETDILAGLPRVSAAICCMAAERNVARATVSPGRPP